MQSFKIIQIISLEVVISLKIDLFLYATWKLTLNRPSTSSHEWCVWNGRVGEIVFLKIIYNDYKVIDVFDVIWSRSLNIVEGKINLDIVEIIYVESFQSISKLILYFILCLSWFSKQFWETINQIKISCIH